MHAMSINILRSPRVGKGKMSWADAHDGPYRSWSLWVVNAWVPLACWIAHGIPDARWSKGPGKLRNGWTKRLYMMLAASHTTICNNRATLEPGIRVEKKGVINSYYAQCNRNSLQPQMELARTHGILPHGCSCWISSLPACPRNLGCEG